MAQFAKTPTKRKLELQTLRAQIAARTISTAALRKLLESAKHKKVRQVAYAELVKRRVS